MASGKIELHVAENDPGDPDEDEVVYISLPAHPGRGIGGVVAKQIRLSDVIGNCGRVDVYLDFNTDGELIGLELLT